jgi:hypothetical protein
MRNANEIKGQTSYFLPKEQGYLRACKGFHQSAASAKLNPELRLFIEPLKDFINRLRAPN